MERSRVREAASDQEGGTNNLTPISYKKIFLDQFPFYLSIGMTPEQYWHGDVYNIRAYREAYHLQRQRQNEMLWLQGAYVYDAVLAASPVFHDFAKKGTKALPYMEYPVPLTPKEAREQREEKERRRYEELKKFSAAMREKKNTGGDELG